jgi:hypothetical protein
MRSGLLIRCSLPTEQANNHKAGEAKIAKSKILDIDDSSRPIKKEVSPETSPLSRNSVDWILFFYGPKYLNSELGAGPLTIRKKMPSWGLAFPGNSQLPSVIFSCGGLAGFNELVGFQESPFRILPFRTATAIGPYLPSQCRIEMVGRGRRVAPL